MQSHDRVSTTGTAAGEGGGRKSSKPIMEKRRRARINASLAELKSLLLEAIRKEGARHNKMEKADILEMAVKHLRQIQRQQFTGEPMSSESCVSSRYQLGYQACAQEVSKYLDSNSDEEIELKTKLLNHLANCVTSDTFPHQVPTPPGSELSIALSGRTSLGLLNPPASSIMQSKHDAYSMSSSSSASLSLPSSAVPTSLLPSTVTSSVRERQASSLPHYLPSSSSFMTSSEVTRPGAPPVFIPIPISPLSIGTVSPASITSGILTPEKQKPHAGSQAVNNNQSNHISVANSLDISAVRISDTGCYKTFSMNQTPNSQTESGKHTAHGGLSLLSTANLSTATVNPRPNLEMNNNLVMPLLANNNTKMTEKTTGMLMASSLDPHISGQVDQQGVASGLEPNNNTTIIDKSTNNLNNNNHSLAVSSFVNANERFQQTMHLDQSQVVQLLQQQQQQQQVLQTQHQQTLNTVLCQGPPQKDQQPPQVILSNNDGALNANTSIITNMNQLQLIPTKTANGEIAFVLSTGLLNPTPLAIRPGSQANFAIPLHLPPAASLSQLSATQPATTARLETSQIALQTNQQNQEVKEIAQLPFHESEAANANNSSQSFRVPNIVSQAPSVFLTPQKENEQLAPLNLSSPNHKDFAPSQLPDPENDQYSSGRKISTKISTQHETSYISSTSAPASTPTMQYRTRASTLSPQALVSNINTYRDNPGHHLEKDVDFRRIPSTEASNSSFTDPPALLAGPRRAIGFEVPNSTLSYQSSPPGSFKPHEEDENANFAGFSRREMAGVFASRVHRSPRHSHSPPEAHSTEGRRRTCSDAGHPLRHDRSRTLFRPW